ncbi:PP-loop family-domain-containing protein [Thamnocephalis sphaerospora]|uniref:tRNA(Ile)-lysidine synthetase n=1 Tax=Thamnocephalis sphaerospora TaxID=78915 RepID=A0A4P9XNH6_9FUNG|nr:PP-loop family-domain-containing protein [Thamnocephalis sphaerospora]|eukprot:RKP07496.1 PP-loop family-domain-containing protein [Thamnocephalis sphaerospora]
MSTPVLREEFCALLRKLCVPLRGSVGVAVSGGADSMALCHLLAATLGPERVHAFTVDHRLRKESTEEAQRVAAVARAMGVQHTLLTIQWPDQRPPTLALLETLARHERYALLARACRAAEARWLFVGHHADDRQETAIFRLARASGVYGLAGLSAVAGWPFPYDPEAMAAATEVARVVRKHQLGLLRPLLDVPKHRLEATCRNADVRWFEDPSNRSSAHQRNVIRMALQAVRQRSNEQAQRKAAGDPAAPLAAIDSSPLSFTRLQTFCDHMMAHRMVIDEQASAFAASHTRFESATGVAYLTLAASGSDVSDFFQLPRPVRHRVLAMLHQRVRAAEHPPRLDHLQRIEATLREPQVGQMAKPVVHAGLYLLPTRDRATTANMSLTWLIARQPLTHAEQTNNCITLAEWSHKQDHPAQYCNSKAADDTNAISTAHECSVTENSVEMAVVWDKRLRVRLAWSLAAVTQARLGWPAGPLQLVVRAFNPMHDTAAINGQLTTATALAKQSLAATGKDPQQQQKSKWQQFCRLPVPVRATQPVLVLVPATHSSYGTAMCNCPEQIVAVPTVGLILVPWLNHASSLHIAGQSWN